MSKQAYTPAPAPITYIMLRADAGYCQSMRGRWTDLAEAVLAEYDRQERYIKEGIPAQPYVRVFASTGSELEELSFRVLRVDLEMGVLAERDKAQGR